jgi:hypothetical protein
MKKHFKTLGTGLVGLSILIALLACLPLGLFFIMLPTTFPVWGWLGPLTVIIITGYLVGMFIEESNRS